jgi:NTP pyrophosphatase (non-canonical NTP hydrolase)
MTQPLPTPEEIHAAVDVLQRACHGAAQHWWTNPKTGVDIRENPMCFDQKLILIVSEVSEAMEGNRKDLMDDKLPHRKMREVELGDALIRICDTAGGFGMDLAGAVVEKMAFNAIRPDHKTENRIAEGGKAY